MTDGLHGAHLRRNLVTRFGEHAVRVSLRDGLFDQPWRGVVVERSRALNLETRAAAALFTVGQEGMLSHQTAAALHGCSAAEDCTDIHVTMPAASRVRGRPGLVVHHADIAGTDVVTRRDLRVEVADLAIAELLCVAPRWQAFACVDQALAAVPATQREVFRAEVDSRLIYREDRRGTVRGEVLLALATGLAESPPESWLRLLVVDAGFPLPEPQFEVVDIAGRPMYRLDLAWPQLRIALEYDGYAAHEGRAEADAERDRRLAARGWVVIRVRADDLKAPDRMIASVRGAFRSRGRVA